MLTGLRRKFMLIATGVLAVLIVAFALILYAIMGSQTVWVVAVGMIVVLALFLLLLAYVLNLVFTKPIEESFERQKQFISNASHELKTPLTLILTDADLVEMDCGESEWLDDIRTEARDMSELINQMLVLSHLDEDTRVLQLESVDISKIVEETIHSWRGKAESKGLEIRGVVEEGVSCKTDAASLKQILFILMDNATKYCDASGYITFDLSKKGRKHVCIYVEETYSKALTVDTEHVFERFYRADVERAEVIGHGIGLALARDTARNLGGSLDVYTKDAPPSMGFKLTL